MNFNSEEIAFLEKYNISHEKVFDAMGMRKSVWTELIRGSDYVLVCRATPCKKYGHTLRTRAGHCAQCNPANIDYQNRYHEKRNLYIAQSLKGDLIKIGITDGLKERQRTLNSQMYAGERDWLIIFNHYVDNAGDVESKIKAVLSSYAVKIEHYRDGELKEATETFRCDKNFVIKVVNKIIGKF